MTEKRAISATTSPDLPAVGADGRPLNEVECVVDDLVREVDAGRARLPALSPIARHAERLAERAVVSRADLLRVAEAEPAVSARILHLANTRYHDPQLPHVASLDRAIDLVGPDRIRKVIGELAASVPDSDGWDAGTHELRKLWTNTLFTALMAREIADRSGAEEPEVAFVAATFHNVGEVLIVSAVARRMEQRQQAFRVDDALIAAVGRYHTELGNRILREWAFPERLSRLAAEHHRPVTDPLQAVVVAAWEAALDYGYSYLGADPDPARLEASLQHLGLRPTVLSECIRRIGPELNDALTLTG